MGRTLNLTRGLEPIDDARPSAGTILYQGAVPLRRAALYVLCDAGALSLESLAERVVARLDRHDDRDVGPARDETIVALYHNHLQHLSDAGLVVYDEETGVALHSNVDEHRVRALLQAGEGEWDALCAILSNARRERIVTVLESQDEPVSIEDLAGAIVAFADAKVGGPQQAVESTSVSLHHVDLPKLDEAGVVTYDQDAGRVELASVPDAYFDAAGGVNTATA